MPYIPQDQKQGIVCVDTKALSMGQLNYFLTKSLLSRDPQTYAEYNALIGVLECCKLEFYRRAVAVYEDQKIQENGDVYA
jgi:hypothetical protein